MYKCLIKHYKWNETRHMSRGGAMSSLSTNWPTLVITGDKRRRQYGGQTYMDCFELNTAISDEHHFISDQMHKVHLSEPI